MGLKKIIDLDLLDRFLTKVKELIPTKTSDLENDSGYMSGMTILSYGSSTWNDFIEAYSDNKVVYCRASSNSNPASGSQTRMAFMAYVNNQTTPTNVEFQYYRSVNQHTDAQQGDQVFVYKLDKNSGWSVTTRNAFSKVVAGTGLSSNYSSGTITLNSSYESKAAESGGTDLSLVTTGEKAIWNAASSDQSVMLITFTKISSTSFTPDISYSDAMTAIQAGTILFAKLNDDGIHDNIYRLDEYVARSSVVVNVPYIEFSLVTMEQIGYSNVKKKRIRWNSTSPNTAYLSTDEQSQTKFGCVHLVDENDGIRSYQDPPTGTLHISPILDYLSDISELYNLAWGQAVNNYSGILLINGNPQNGQLPFEIYECPKAEWDHSETDVEEITLTFTSIGYRNDSLIFKTITVIGAPYTYDWQSYSVTYSEIPASGSSYESKEPVSGGTDVSLVTTGEKYTWNNKGTYSKPSGGIPDSDIASAATWNAKGNGTITGITMNGASKGTSGVVNLGTVITAHQDISGKADKSATVSNVAYDSTNKKITKTINGTASDVVTVATLKSAMSLSKSDVGLGNVENKSSATIRGELTKANVTTALGYTPPTTDTTYESKAAASGGTDVSLVTTGEKYTWNAKGNGTITGIKMNGSSKGTSGVVDLGTVITSHQDISGKADKSATVSNVAYDSTNKKITKTINGTTSDVVSAATLKSAMSLAKGDVGLGNVDNVKQYSASNPPPYPVTSVNGSTGAVTVSVPSAGTATPKMDGTAAVGTSAKYAKEDHVHPSDTTKADKANTALLSGGTEIKSNDDLNTFTTVGNYYCRNSSTAATLSNCPISTWFYMRVSLNDGVSPAWPCQEIINGTNGRRYYRYDNGGNGWTSWIEYAPSPSAATVAPKMDGTAAVGSSAKYAKEDHVHPVDTSRAPASHTHSADNILGGYLNIHPENSPTLIPFMHNDIAHLLSRGGSAVVKYDGTQQSVDISSVFDGSGSYWAINPTGITTIVIELTLHKAFGWTSWIYADFGASNWRAKSVSVDVINTNYAEDVWTNKYQTTDNGLGHIAFSTAHTPVGASNSGAGFNKIRFTFSVWATSTIFRIAQLGIYNYGSLGLRETYMSRGVDDAVFRSITPNANVTYDLGSSSNKWNHAYAKYLNDTEIPASPKFTDTTALGSMTGTLGVGHGGTGKTNAKDAANAFMNALDTGSSTPVDADYYISQYVSGGTTTTTYHRRPMSALWEYIKGKISSVLGLTASSYGGSAAKVNNHTVAVDVPSNAKFTDTTYESKAAASGGTDVSLVTTGEKATWNAKTSNVGTITGIKMNGASKGTSGVVDLGTVITAHQDISGKADKSATVSTVAYDSTNKKITKTINGTASDVVTVATLKSAMSLAKGDVGLGNVENKSSATIRGELTKANVTTALGYTPPTTNTTYSAGDGLIQNGTTFSDHRGIEYIRGTWTAASGTWTGVSTDTELYDGKQIILYMPFAGSGNATLNLTLADGGTTGAKNVYFESTTRFTTHKGQNSQLHLIYHSALTLSNGNTYEGWWYVANRDTTDVYKLGRSYNSVKAKAAIYRYQILLTYDGEYLLPVSNGNNNVETNKTMTTEKFDPLAQIYYWSTTTTVNASAKLNDWNLCASHYSNGLIDLRYAFNTAKTLTANKAIYLVCVPQSDGSAKLHTTPISQTLPTTEDGYIYKYLGQAYDTYRISLDEHKPCYYYKNGCIRLWTNQIDTTYESKAAASGGTAVSLVTTGEKYTWNNKQNKVTASGVLKGNGSGTVSAATKGTDYGALSFTVSLTVAGWSSNAQTITNSNFVTSGYAYIVTPASGSYAAYAAAQIYADDVTTASKMKFHCVSKPSAALTVNVLRVVSA